MKKFLFSIMLLLSLTSLSSSDNLNQNNEINSKDDVVKTRKMRVLVGKDFLIGKEFVHKKYSQLKIGFNENQIYGSTGINDFYANFDVNFGKLKLDKFAMTLATGSDEELKIEKLMLEILEKNTLMFYDQNTEMLEMVVEDYTPYMFKRVK